MWNSIKSFFGLSGSKKNDDGDADNNNNNDDDEEPTGGYLSTANEIKKAQDGLTKLRAELVGVEQAIKDARVLVRKAETQQQYFRCTLANLEMECHDFYLHPEMAETEAEMELEHNANNNSTNGNDNDDAKKAEQRRANAARTRQMKAQLRAAIQALEERYLPQIDKQRDALDLGAFRLTIRLSRLKADEDETRRRLLELQAEAHEKWEQYAVADENGGELGNNASDGNGNNNMRMMTAIVPRPSAEAANNSQHGDTQAIDLQDHNNDNNNNDSEEAESGNGNKTTSSAATSKFEGADFSQLASNEASHHSADDSAGAAIAVIKPAVSSSSSSDDEEADGEIKFSHDKGFTRIPAPPAPELVVKK